MEKLKIALCDNRSFYCERFEAYMVSHKAKEVELFLYSVQEQLEEALKTMRFDVLLVGAGFENFFHSMELEDRILYLSERMPDCVAEDAMWQREDAVPKEVSRYEPMEQLMQKIYVMAGKTGNGQQAAIRYKRLKVTGVCSPIGHEMQQLFSVLYAVNLGREKKILYVNLLEYSGFGELFGQTGGCDMADLLLRLRAGTLDLSFFWRCACEKAGIYCLMPFDNPENTAQTGEQELRELLDFVEHFTDFEEVVIDFGISMTEYYSYLDFCDVMLMIGREGYYYQCRENAFLKWVREAQTADGMDRLCRVTVPYSARTIRPGGSVIEQLQWSEFGDFVRQYTTKSGRKRGKQSEDNRPGDTGT